MYKRRCFDATSCNRHIIIIIQHIIIIWHQHNTNINNINNIIPIPGLSPTHNNIIINNTNNNQLPTTYQHHRHRHTRSAPSPAFFARPFAAFSPSSFLLSSPAFARLQAAACPPARRSFDIRGDVELRPGRCSDGWPARLRDQGTKNGERISGAGNCAPSTCRLLLVVPSMMTGSSIRTEVERSGYCAIQVLFVCDDARYPQSRPAADQRARAKMAR